jgi:hypothetical protein
MDRYEESSNVPYDPDMSVLEALQEGLIAVVDSGVIGSGAYQPCNALPPTRQEANLSIRCSRMKGHAGVHAYVARWARTFEDVERAQYAHQLRLEQERRAKNQAEAQMRAAKKAAAAQAEAMNKAARAMAQRLDEITPAMQKIGKSIEEAEFKALHREDSQVYGLERSKRAKYRDRGVGKVRGK